MSALPAPVAAVRAAVRSSLTGCPGGALVLVGCSGGPDSLALAAAVAFVAPRLGLRAGLITVDHGLQDGSAHRAGEVAAWARSVGFQVVEVAEVRVAGRPGGPEAAARHARYEALVGAAHRHGAVAVLVGHTRDDQAETVLLAMARGAGPRGVAGMPARRDIDGVALLRPLLDVSREQTGAACAVSDLRPWTDPHNGDPAYARARVRGTALPALVAALGPAVLANLARTAELVAADNAALDEWAARALAEAGDPGGRVDGSGGDTPGGPAGDTVAGGAGDTAGGGAGDTAGGGAAGGGTGEGLRVAALAELPAGVRGRALHAWAKRLGAPGGALSYRHVAALDALVTRWHGQGPVHLPGGVLVVRAGGLLRPAPR